MLEAGDLDRFRDEIVHAGFDAGLFALLVSTLLVGVR